MRRLVRSLVIALAVAAAAVGIGMFVADLTTSTRGVASTLVVAGTATYLLVAF